MPTGLDGNIGAGATAPAIDLDGTIDVERQNAEHALAQDAQLKAQVTSALGVGQAIMNSFEKLRKTHIVFNPLENKGEDALQIMDMCFAMPELVGPPTVIRVDKQNMNFSWQTLRTKGASKTTSGYGRVGISFSLYFVGTFAINTGLRRLLAIFDATPFVYIENKFIRQNLAPETITPDAGSMISPYDTMAASLLNISVRTEPGMTDVLVADVDLTWFNYKPFSPHFWFRETWEAKETLVDNTIPSQPKSGTTDVVASQAEHSAEHSQVAILSQQLALTNSNNLLLAESPPTIDPAMSEPLMDRIALAHAEVQPIGRLHSGVTFNFNRYRTLTSIERRARVDALLAQIPYTMVDITSKYVYAGRSKDPNHPVRMCLNKEAAEAFEKMAQDFFEEFGYPIRVGSAYRTQADQDVLLKNNKIDEILKEPLVATWSWHTVGLAIDISLETYEGWSWLVNNGREYGFSNLGLRLAVDKNLTQKFWELDAKGHWGQVGESWHWDYLPGQQKLQAQYRDENNRINQRLPADKRLTLIAHTISTAQKLIRHEANKGDIDVNIAASMKEQLDKTTGDKSWIWDPSASSSTSLVFKHPEQLIIDEQDQSLIPQQIVISKSNIIAQLPIIGHQYATQQYLGSTDANAVIVFTAVGLEKLTQLQSMINLLQANARHGRCAREASVIEIINPIFGLLGMHKAMIEDITVQSISGSPDAYQVSLRLTQFKHTDVPDLQQEKFIDTANKEALYARTFYDNVVKGVTTIQLQQAGTLARTTMAAAQGLSSLIPKELFSGQDVPALLQSAVFAHPVPLDTHETKEVYGIVLAPALRRILTETNFEVERYVGYLDREVTHTIEGGPITALLIGVRDSNSSGKTAAARINVAYALSQNGKLGPLEDALRSVIAIYGATLVILNTPGFIKRSTLEQLGIPEALVPNRTIVSEDHVFTDSNVERIQRDFLADALLAHKHAATLILRSGLIMHDIFRSMYYKLQDDMRRYTDGLAAYPDLNLPPHPSTNSILDTDPDYYFYNESPILDDAAREKYGQDALAVARATYDSIAANCSKSAYDKSVISFNKFYLNAQLAPEVAFDTLFADGDAPLHSAFELDGGKLAKIYKQAKGARAPMRRNMPPNLPGNEFARTKTNEPVKFGQHTSDKNKIEDKAAGMPGLIDTVNNSWKTFEESTYKMARAFPTFKIYFIEDDSIEETRQFSKIRNFDDFYSYSAIKDLRIVRSRKFPASLCVITVVNVNGALDFLQFSQRTDPSGESRIQEQFDPLLVDTAAENPFSKLIVVEGSKIQVRLGYSSNPEKLDTVFNGQVVEVSMVPEMPDVVQLVCQSYGVELTSELKGTDPSNTDSFESTQELLSAMLCSPEVVHFGRWEKWNSFHPGEIRTRHSASGAAGPIDTLVRDARWSVLQSYAFYNDPSDDNVFAPDFYSYLPSVGGALHKVATSIGISVLFINNIINKQKYWPNYNTIWDIFREMSLRHPGFVYLPVPYGQRYTMFFGPPSHGYWSRPLNAYENLAYKNIEQLVERFKNWESRHSQAFRAEVAAAHLPNSEWVTDPLVLNGTEDDREMGRRRKAWPSLVETWGNIKREQLHAKHKRWIPFRSYWTLTSDHHIIANNIRASSHGTYNAVNLRYFNTPLDAKGQEGAKETYSPIGDNAHDALTKTLVMKADDNIEDKDTRVMDAEFMTCFDIFYARRYAVALLMETMRDAYKGEIVILGNPKMKPYDVCYLYDSYNDMYGPVEIEQVVHIFSQETGFITEITPDLVVNANDWTTQSTLDAMWSVGTNIVSDVAAKMNVPSAIAAVGLGTVGLLAGGIVGLAAAMYGGYKYIFWTQERQPIIITPLIHGHKPLLAGVDGYKLDSLVLNFRGRWDKFVRNFNEGWKAFWAQDTISDYLKERIAEFANG